MCSLSGVGLLHHEHGGAGHGTARCVSPSKYYEGGVVWCAAMRCGAVPCSAVVWGLGRGLVARVLLNNSTSPGGGGSGGSDTTCPPPSDPPPALK